MPTSTQRSAGFLLLAFFAGLAIGYYFHAENRLLTGPPMTSIPAPAAERGTTAADTTDDPARSESSSPGPVSDDALANALVSAARTPDSFRQKHDLYDIAMKLDAEGIARALKITQSFARSERDLVQPTLLARWLDFDPAAALGWARALPRDMQRETLLREFFHSLGLKNPTAALQSFNAFDTATDRGRDSYAYHMFEAWATNDPAGAAQAALGLAGKDSRTIALNASVNRWAGRDPLAALAWVQQLPEGAARRTQVGNVLRAWAARDPQAALASALTLAEGAERNGAVAMVIEGAAQNDAQAAKQMLAQLPEGPARNAGTTTLINRLGYLNPEAVADLILTMPPAQQRNSAYNVASYLAHEDPTRALAWAAQLGSDEARQVTTDTILKKWAESDPRAAAEYQAQHLPSMQNSGFSDTVASWAYDDSTAALAWAHALPDEKLRERAVAGAIRGLADRDPRQAVTLASTSLTGVMQRDTMRRIASTWTASDLPGVLAWATQLPDSTKEQALVGVTSTWARNDPRATAQWLDKMPAGPLRDSIVASFVSTVGQDDPESAVIWVSTIGDDDRRNYYVQTAFSSWARINKAAAATWLERTTSISDTTRETLKSSLR